MSKKLKFALVRAQKSSRDALLKAGVVTALALSSVASHAAGIDDLFDAVDLSGVAAKITALGIIIVGIAFVMKGPSIVKRIISKI